LQVFLHTGLHGAVVYKNAHYVELPGVTSDTRTVIRYAKKLLAGLYKSGYEYKKVGVILTDLSNVDNMQFDIFAHNNIKQGEKLMQAVDLINRRLGKGTLQFAATGGQKDWQMKSENRTKNYIGDWKELPRVLIKVI